MLSRGVIRGSRRVQREAPPLVRNGASEEVEEEFLEIPVPDIVSEDPDEIAVLHVDDDPQYTDLTKTMLEREDENLSVTPETSVVEAIKHLEQGDVDCIISDYDMPTTNGLEFLTIVREQYPDIAFILFTGKGSEEIASEAIRAGVTDYVQKKGGSEQFEVLANRISNAVERYQAQQRFWDALSWYKRLVEQNLAGVFIFQDGEFVYVNERLAEIFGYSQVELVGESPEVLSAESKKASFADHLAAASGEETFECELTGRHADGSELSLEVHGGFIQYEGERGYIGVVWDRTD